MVGILERTIGREIRGLHEAAYLVAGFGLLGQLVALLRDRTFAHVLGAGETLDLYYAAFRIPDLLFAAVASLASLYVLIPFLEQYEREGLDAVRRFLSELCTLLSGAMLVVALLLAAFAVPIVTLVYPGIEGEARETLVQLVRIMLIQPVLLAVSSLFLAVVQSAGRYFLYALAPVLYNLGILLGALLLYPVFGIVGLAYGVVLGAFLHLAIQLPFLASHKRLPRIVWGGFTVPLWSIMCTSLPRTLTLSLQQLSLLTLVSFAAALGTGSVAVFSLATNLQAVPLSLIGASYSVAAFPMLAKLFAAGAVSEGIEKARVALIHTLFWALPAALGVALTSATFVTVVLGTGAFSDADVALTARILVYFAFSLPAQALTLLFVRIAYAMGRTTTPLVGALMGSAVTVSCAWFFTDSGGVFPFVGPVQSLAVAFSVGAWVTALFLFGTLVRVLPEFTKGLVPALGRSVVACGALFIVYRGVYAYGVDTPHSTVAALTGAALALVAWVCVHVMLRSPELASMRALVPGGSHK